MNICLIIIIFIVLIFICQILCLENFDETKINTSIKAKERINQFDLIKFKPYIDKYFKPLNIIDLKTIPVIKNGLIL